MHIISSIARQSGLSDAWSKVVEGQDDLIIFVVRESIQYRVLLYGFHNHKKRKIDMTTSLCI